MRPSKSTNDYLYGAQFTSNGGITGTGSMSVNDLMGARKG